LRLWCYSLSVATERRTPTITITGTVITIIITGTTDITGITVTGTIDIGDIITGVIDKY
jgi:hypothetical protein